MKYLALGDSYTIGEQIEPKGNFPNQLTVLLQKQYFSNLEEPEIIAQTGWTSEELYKAVEEKHPSNDYDLITLLIGVNDQYRGLPLDQYERYFLKLLMRAILFAKGQSRRVFILSIPDWGLTPFAKNQDQKAIAQAIDAFNTKNKTLALAYRCHYIDITETSRIQGTKAEFLAKDQLHYSAEAYKEWAIKALRVMGPTLEALEKTN